MTAWLDRDGRRIDEGEASVKIGDPAYAEVDRTVVTEPGVAGWTFEVLTIWLGLNIAEQTGKMELFETLVFNASGFAVYTRRYATEYQAIMGHDMVVARLAEGMTSPVIEHISPVLQTEVLTRNAATPNNMAKVSSVASVSAISQALERAV